MLLLWTLGIVFMFKVFLQINNGKTGLPFVLILIFIFCPAWAEWAMKARGGYITSFVLSAVFLNLLFYESTKYTPLRYLFMGLLSILIYESQPLWLPGLAPFLFYALYKSGSLNRAINNVLAFITACSLVVPFYIYKNGLPHYYNPEYSFGMKQIISNFKVIPAALYSSLHGHYFTTQMFAPDFFSSLIAYTFLFIILGLLPVAIYNVATRKQGSMLFNLSVLSIALTIICVLPFKEVQHRYLLPVIGYVLLAILIFTKTSPAGQRFFRIAGPVLITAGIISLILFKDFRYSTMQKGKFGQLIGHLLSKDVHYVYCADYMLTYQLLFYSKEHIIARDRTLPGRYPAYSNAVDSAYKNGLKTAFIFNELQFTNMDLHERTQFNGYLIMFDPPRNKMERIFQFNK